MVRRKNPRGKLKNCAVARCTAKLKNSEFPQHYLNVHESDTGRFECSGCGYQCSNSDICIQNHIDEVHEEEENAEASFNPFRKQNLPRITNQHTDQCRDDRVKVKVKSKAPKKVSQEREKVEMRTITVSMNSQPRVVIPAGNMNTQTENVVRAKKSRVITNENNANKRRSNEVEQVDVEVTPKRRKPDEAGSSTKTRNTARGSVQAGKGKSKKLNETVVTSETPGEVFRQVIFGDDEDNTADNTAEREMPEDVETEPGLMSVPATGSGLSNQSDESDEDGGEFDYEEESDQEQSKAPPVVEEAQLPPGEITRRRVEKDKKAFIEAFVKAHISYTFFEFDDLMLELLERWTNEPRQTTEELIENVGGRDPHAMFLVDMVCPANIGDEEYVEEVHECVVASAKKLHINFVYFLISSSKRFKVEVARKIWRSLMIKAAEYRFDEQRKVDEDVLKEKMLALRILCEAYRRAAE